MKLDASPKQTQQQKKPPSKFFFILGSIFISLSILLTLIFNSVDKKLGDELEKFRVYGLDVVEYQINEQSAINTSFMILLGTEIVPPYKKLDYFKQHFHIQNIETLSSLHRALFGEDPDSELVQKWNTITNPNEFQDEKKIMYDRAIEFKGADRKSGRSIFGQNLLNRITDLKSKRDTLISFAIFFQIIGLLLNQIAYFYKDNS